MGRRPKRYRKRLECEFCGAGITYKGFVSNISDKGLFTRTRRSFREDSSIDIKLYLPDDSISNVSGVARHALNSLDTRLVKNGMGIELTQIDDNFLRLVRRVKGLYETEEKPENREPEKVVILCMACGVNDAVLRDKLSLGQRCGNCKVPLPTA